MKVVNALRHAAAEVTMFRDKAAFEHLLVVIKATYAIPENGKTPRPLSPSHPKFAPLAMKDDFTGEAGLSAPLYENDFASRKAMCDVVFNASAHAPGGRPVRELKAAVAVGGMSKAINVVGNRRWEKDLLHIRHSAPEPFVEMPLHYGRAFGGCRNYKSGDVLKSDAYMPNPVGVGYSSSLAHEAVHGMPLPNLEMPGRRLSRPDEKYPPVALSPVARNFYPRHTYAGTYDQVWRENVAPFLPEDFDETFFQCAPEDQRINFPKGGEEVRFVNMMPGRPEVFFRLPRLNNMPVKVLRDDLTGAAPEAVADTLCFRPDEGNFSVVWRAFLRLGQKGLRGIRLVAIGHVCGQWWDAVSHGASGCGGCRARLEKHDGELPEGCPETADEPAMRKGSLEKLRAQAAGASVEEARAAGASGGEEVLP